MNTRIHNAEEYAAWIAKFGDPRTTDDCFTPPKVYEAVARWVEREYGVSRDNFVRPFYPGGDYTTEEYGKDDIVVDNPPFSIISKIIDFYVKKGVRFFLFGPALALAGSSASRNATLIPVGADIVYQNGAKVKSGFITNLDDPSVQMRSAPELYEMLKKVAEGEKAKMPKYEYPNEIVTCAMVQKWGSYGVEYILRRGECVRVGELDEMKRDKKEYIRWWVFAIRTSRNRTSRNRTSCSRTSCSRTSRSEKVGAFGKRKGNHSEIVGG